ncbi:Nephrocystin-3 [Stylophora pistillata]|uniref:Nephrocystin-3 n=2 Tax=Stylophora pistillata TaxID=50429 RepID=A0A2B4S844_STYPI|nr:Nephrocystin-3 [Stylophora pistillata]
MYRSECEGFTVTISPCLAKKTILEASVYLLRDEEIDKEDFLAIYEITTMRRQHPYKQYERIDDVFDATSPEEFAVELSQGMEEDEAVNLLKRVSQIADKQKTKQVAKVLEYQPLALAAAAYYVQTVAAIGSPHYSWEDYLAVLMQESMPMESAVEFVHYYYEELPEELVESKISRSSLFLFANDGEDWIPELASNFVDKENCQDSSLPNIMLKVNVLSLRSHKHWKISASQRTVRNVEALNIQQTLVEGLNIAPGAIEQLEKALVILKMTYGEDHLRVTETYNRLGLVYSDIGKYKEAKDMHEKALHVLAKNYGEEHVCVADTCFLLANASTNSEEYETVKELHARVLKILMKIRGEEHLSVGYSYFCLGDVFHSIGQKEKAKELYEKGLGIQKKIFGEENAMVAIYYCKLGKIYQGMGKLSQATHYHNKTLKIFKNAFGEGHLDVAACYNRLGYCFLSIQQYNEAKENYEKALMILKNLFGEEYRDVAMGYYNLANMYEEIGEYKEAIELWLHLLSGEKLTVTSIPKWK